MLSFAGGEVTVLDDALVNGVAGVAVLDALGIRCQVGTQPT